jgi:hypothetical protein
MTELIVALDGPNEQYRLGCRLYDDVDFRWFKLGPRALWAGH